VSTCSGTDARSRQRATLTGAAVETMEGAAMAAASEACGVPWIQLRAVSNWTGDRNPEAWRLPEALETVQHAIGILLEGKRPW
jgi:futalosine hydrolase